MNDPIDLFVRATAVLIGAYLVLLLGRALAARIAGDHADLVLSFALISFSLPLPLRSSEDDQKNDAETDNTTTPGNTGKHAETPPEMQTMMKVTDVSGQRLVPEWDTQQWESFEIARRNAIVLLNKCILYYQEHPKEKDTGQIPHYKKLGMNAGNRGGAVNDLWESGFCSKGPSGSYIHPEVARSCSELYQHIVKRDPKYRVYPYGYERQKNDTLDNAVNAIPLAG
jgi:hypothetical protein